MPFTQALHLGADENDPTLDGVVNLVSCVARRFRQMFSTSGSALSVFFVFAMMPL